MMTEVQLSAETLFSLLQNRHRRYLLYSLQQNDESVVTLDELTRRILDWEQRMDAGGDPTDELKTRIRISLHHTHLPKISEAGLVEYDPHSETVRKRDAPSVTASMEKHQDEVPHLRSLFCTSKTS